jgi:hypothetical protein
MPNDNKIPDIRLSPRDRQILEHVHRHRLTTVAVLRHRLLGGLSTNAIAKITRRLCRANYLQSFVLCHPTRYFVIGDVGAQVMGVGRHRVEPLGPQSLPQEYGALIYATFSKQSRLRLTKQEIRQHCPWMPRRMFEATFCSNLVSKTLELIRVDLGGPVDHVARKCVADINELRCSPQFQPFLSESQFRLVVITATREKSISLRQALDRHDWPTGLAIHFSILPELLTLSRSSRHA